MLGWAISLGMILAWAKFPDTNVTMLCASGLFAIAGSVANGFSKISDKM